MIKKLISVIIVLTLIFQIYINVQNTTAESQQEDIFTITGRIVDMDNKPIVNKIVELHSDPIITRTDSEGNYKFENVRVGEHALYIKEVDGTQIASALLKISYGNATKNNRDKVIIEGNTIIDFKLTQNGIKIINIATIDNTPNFSKNEKKDVNYNLRIFFIIILIVTVIIGFLIRHILRKNRKPPERKSIIHL